MLEGFSPAQLGLLGALVFFAGLVDALAGGGGLITLPAYLSAGLDPALVLGTNKLSSSIGTVASAAQYQRKLRLPLKDFAPAIAASLAGSYGGARLARLLDPSWLRYLLVGVMPLLAYLIHSKHGFGRADRSAELGARELLSRSILVSLPIGLYDGFFGPGTGTFFALALARFCRYDLLGATARAKALNLVSNLSALAAFLATGQVHLSLGLGMGALSVGGHYAGSRLGLKRGAEAIRPAVLAVLAGLFLKLIVDLLAAA